MVQQCRNNQPLIQYKNTACISHFALSFEKETIQQKGESACGANNDPSPRTHTNACPRFPFPARVCVLSDGRTVALSVCLKEDFLSFSFRGVIPEKDLPSVVGRTSCDWELPVTDTHTHTQTRTHSPAVPPVSDMICVTVSARHSHACFRERLGMCVCVSVCVCVWGGEKRRRLHG